MAVVRQVLNQGEITRLLTSPQRGTAINLLARGYRVEAMAKTLCPVDQGRLKGSIHTRLVRLGGPLICEVGTDVEYAIFVHEGTGLYGPRHALIYPRSAKVLVFTPRKSGGKFVSRKNRTTVFVRYTRGMPGTPFLRKALVAARG